MIKTIYVENMRAEQLKELDSLHLLVMDAYKLFDRESISINQIHL
jgi:hypothetical protein